MVDAFFDRDGGGLLSSTAHLGGGGIVSLAILGTILPVLYCQSPRGCVCKYVNS